MAKQPINTIKNWFKTGLKPTQQQFWDWLDSYRHKDDKVASADVDGLQDLLDAKVDKKDVVEPEIWDATKPYVYDSAAQQYVSYSNPNNEVTQFKNEGFYRLLANTAAGESPETHPEKWAYQGTVIGDITINDVIGLNEGLGNKADLVAGKVPADQLPELGGSGSALLLTLAENPTYYPDDSVKIMKQQYVDDPTKFYEQRFEYTNGIASKIEIKDDISDIWLRKTDLYNAAGQLQKPTIATIEIWTII